MCLHVYRCRSICICVHMHIEARSWYSFLSQSFSILIFWNRDPIPGPLNLDASDLARHGGHHYQSFNLVVELRLLFIRSTLLNKPSPLRQFFLFKKLILSCIMNAMNEYIYGAFHLIWKTSLSTKFLLKSNYNVTFMWHTHSALTFSTSHQWNVYVSFYICHWCTEW